MRGRRRAGGLLRWAVWALGMVERVRAPDVVRIWAERGGHASRSAPDTRAPQ